MKCEILDRLSERLTFLTSLNKDEVKELYDEVNRFVVNNYLLDGKDEGYYLKYNGKFYQVGYIYGPEVMYYVRLVKKGEMVLKYIDYERMKNNSLTEDEKEIKSIFGNIDDEVNLLKEKGVSLKLINKSFNHERL